MAVTSRPRAKGVGVSLGQANSKLASACAWGFMGKQQSPSRWTVRRNKRHPTGHTARYGQTRQAGTAAYGSHGPSR